MTISASLGIDITWSGDSIHRGRSFSFLEAPPPPPLAESLELFLVDAAGSPAWVNVASSFTRSGKAIEGTLDGLATERTSSRQGADVRYNGGSITFTLRNVNGWWDPLNEGSPWFVAGKTLLKRGLPVRYSITPAGGTKTRIFTGEVTDWPPFYIGSMYSSVTVKAADAVSKLSKIDLPESQVPLFDQQRAGARINQVSENAGWDPANDDVQITSTDTRLQATTFKTDAWSEMLLAAESAGGFLSVNKNNGITYRTRSYPFDQSTVVDHVFTRTPSLIFSTGGEPGTLLYGIDGSTPTNDLSETFNVVKYTNVGGIEQGAVAWDAALNGYLSTARTDLVNFTGRSTMDLALWKIGFYSETEYRFSRIVGELNDENEMWPDVLAVELNDLIEVRQITPDPHPQSSGRPITRTGIVSGISMSRRNKVTTVTFDLVRVPSAVVYYFDDADSNFDDPAVRYAPLIGV